jgi:hypothetical protein
MKQMKQNWPPAEVLLMRLPNRVNSNPGLLEIQVHQHGKTPGEISLESRGGTFGAMSERELFDIGLTRVDVHRVAWGASDRNHNPI